MKKICVIGSLNVDLVGQMETLPRRGETIQTDSFDQLFGGKGANQAVALGKLGADVRMVGLLGDLLSGGTYLEALDRSGVQREAVSVLPGQYPGIAYVAVEKSGSNMLFPYPGTNALVSPTYVDAHWESFSACDIFLFQQEIPPQTNLHAMKRLTGHPGKTVILDPAPAVPMTAACLPYADIVTPNETELELISGLRADSEDGIRAACAALHEKGARLVIAKAGGQGAYVSERDRFTFTPAFSVTAVDTTAAGDSFNAGLAFGLAKGLDLTACVTVGHAVAGLSVTGMGAQSAMPDLATLQAFLQDKRPDVAALL